MVKKRKLVYLLVYKFAWEKEPNKEAMHQIKEKMDLFGAKKA